MQNRLRLAGIQAAAEAAQVAVSLLASRLVPPLTTIERPDRAMAEEAVTVTLQRLDEEGGAPIPQFSFDRPATNRSSVARPRRPDRRPCRPAGRR